MHHIRTINQCIAAIRQQDPDTCISATAIRRLIKSGDIPAIYCGNRAYVALEDVMEYFSCCEKRTQMQVENGGEDG